MLGCGNGIQVVKVEDKVEVVGLDAGGGGVFILVPGKFSA